MRALNSYSLMDWICLTPIKWWLKNLRNYIWATFFCLKKPAELGIFIENLKKELAEKSSSHLYVSIAFERPEVIQLQAELMQKHCVGGVYIVVDNSNSRLKASKIRDVCLNNNVLYLKLPNTLTNHPNRSHSLALQWIYQNIICELEVIGFGFLDHDIMPIRQVSPFLKHARCELFGRRWDSKINHTWQLWPGFAFFKGSSLQGKKVSFLYDFSNKLDTMGMAYSTVFRFHDRKECFCSYREMLVDRLGKIQILDDDWVHLSRSAVRNNLSFEERFRMFESTVRTLES